MPLRQFLKKKFFFKKKCNGDSVFFSIFGFNLFYIKFNGNNIELWLSIMNKRLFSANYPNGNILLSDEVIDLISKLDTLQLIRKNKDIEY